MFWASECESLLALGAGLAWAAEAGAGESAAWATEANERAGAEAGSAGVSSGSTYTYKN